MDFVNRKFSRGDIWYADLGQQRKGSTMHGVRPCVIVSNWKSCKYSTTLIVVPITDRENKEKDGKNIKSQATHVNIGTNGTGLKYSSVVLCEQIITIDKCYFQEKRIGKCSEFVIRMIEDAIKESLWIDKEDKDNIIDYAYIKSLIDVSNDIIEFMVQFEGSQGLDFWIERRINKLKELKNRHALSWLQP